MASIVTAARDIGRLREISAVLVRHGFGEIVGRLGLSRVRRPREPSGPDPRSPEGPAAAAFANQDSTGVEEGGLAVRLRHVLEDLGPSFVKLGQIASTRPDLLPLELITELRKLQDEVPPIPFDQIKEQVERSLGAELHELFEAVDESPLAAASIAQVHAAVLRTENGLRRVVIKVQRPDIARTIESDLDILHTLATLVERTLPETRIYSPVRLVRQFDRAIHDELDFTIEAENATRFAHSFEGDERIRFPAVYPQTSSKHVLTLERFEGQKLDQAVAAGVSRQWIAKTALEVMIKQIFDDGFFHADPHPGNVLVMGTVESPVLGLFDLGMVGRLSPRLRDLTVDLMIGAIRGDPDAIADAMAAIGTPTRTINLPMFREDVATLSEKYLGRSLAEIQLSKLIRDLGHIASVHGLEVPTDFVLVGKAMMTVEGIGRQLAPELDVFQESRPFFLRLLRRRYSPERLGLQFLRRFERLTDATSNLPHQLTDILEDLRTGRLRIGVDNGDASNSADRLGRRILTGCITGCCTLGGTVLLSNQKDAVAGVLLGVGLTWLIGHLARDTVRSLRGRTDRR